MLKLKYVRVIFLLSLWLQLVSCDEADTDAEDTLSYLSQRLTFCAKYFKYTLADTFIINGELTLPNVKLGDTVSIEFYQQPLNPTMHFKGSLLPNESSQEVLSRLRNGQPITFRVDFPIGNNVPELRRISINDKELCATILNNDGSRVLLTHKLEIVNNTLAVFKRNINIPHFVAATATCGQNDMQIINNEVDAGSVVRRGEYPWLGAIYKKQGNRKTFICSGLLVTPEIVLTAANCFQDLTASDIVVELGRNSLTSSVENATVWRDVEAVILHPEYKPGAKLSDADIAVVRMTEPVSFTQYIKSICLSDEPANDTLTSDVSTMMASEADDTTENDCQRSSPVYAVTTATRPKCDAIEIALEICNEQPSANLTLNTNAHWMLQGITFQQRCDLEEHTVYCDIPKHMPWLDNYIEKEAQPIAGAVEDVCGIAGTKSRSEYPWLAAIYKKASVGVLFFCTGTLISSSTVLAHGNCLDLNEGELIQPDFLRVYFGRYDLNSFKEQGVITRDVATLLRHPNYEGAGGLFYFNDIALLQLKEPVSFTQYVKPICLWSDPAVETEIVGQTATLLSWDKLRILDGSLTIPQSLQTNISSIGQCQMTGYNVGILSAYLCAPRFGNNLDGILMLKRNGRWLLRGISTANFFYWKKYKPTRYRLYTDIAEYLPWIQSNMLL